ncbi:hypothetical protein VNO77_05891 [Canavalia gladiata]|uniref:Uncharacterized protein n=1 Tax=Canavalia gladiata TaxID=3824 RepID=A0AAN9R929_CANGL
MNSCGGAYIRKRPNSGRNFPPSHAVNISPVNFRHTSPKIHLSARKLAARLWHLRFFQLESSPPRLKRSKEQFAARGPGVCEPSSNVLAKIHSGKLLTKRRKLIGDSVVSALLSQLLRTQRSIHKLKAQHKSSKKKLEEEKLLLKRQHEAMLEEFKDKLGRERRSRERMESLITKLVHELAQAKLCTNQFMIHYEKEKKKRQLIEQVCYQLAMQIGEERAKLQGLQKHSMKISEEMEQQKKMFQIVELWREESIQMKLLDAKLALEDKYNQMIQLIARLQTFLSSRGDELDITELRDAQLIKKAAESVNIHCITQLLSCDFANSNDMFSIYEELGKGKINDTVIQFEPNYPLNLIGPSSTIHVPSIDEDCLLHQLSTSGDYTAGFQVINSWETVDNVNQRKNMPGSEAECYENKDHGCYKHSDSVAQQNSENPTYAKCEERLATSSIQRGDIGSAFLCKDSGESRLGQLELLGQRNFADCAMNPHITRGMKGRIEWPRGIPKINSKVIPLEERVRKQKSQLHHILKPQA